MKPGGNRFGLGMRMMAAAALAASLAIAPMAVRAADRDAHEDRAEKRAKDMHAKLKITPAQEEMWGKVSQAMRDNAKSLDNLSQAHVEHAKGMSAVDNLKSYGELADAHADGVRKLMPAFSALYASMSDRQKREADALFSRSYDRRARMKAKDE